MCHPPGYDTHFLSKSVVGVSLQSSVLRALLPDEPPRSLSFSASAHLQTEAHLSPWQLASSRCWRDYTMCTAMQSVESLSVRRWVLCSRVSSWQGMRLPCCPPPGPWVLLPAAHHKAIQPSAVQAVGWPPAGPKVTSTPILGLLCLMDSQPTPSLQPLMLIPYRPPHEGRAGCSMQIPSPQLLPVHSLLTSGPPPCTYHGQGT